LVAGGGYLERSRNAVLINFFSIQKGDNQNSRDQGIHGVATTADWTFGIVCHSISYHGNVSKQTIEALSSSMGFLDTVAAGPTRVFLISFRFFYATPSLRQTPDRRPIISL
jgi:hypothetical protein